MRKPSPIIVRSPGFYFFAILENNRFHHLLFIGRAYAVQNAMSINKTLPECKKFLVQLMDVLEAVSISIYFQLKNKTLSIII